jgi:hypothetical protein
MVSFNSELSLIFYLDDLSIGDSGVLKFPVIIVFGSIGDYKSRTICLMKLVVPAFGVHILIFGVCSYFINIR